MAEGMTLKGKILSHRSLAVKKMATVLAFYRKSTIVEAEDISEAFKVIKKKRI